MIDLHKADALNRLKKENEILLRKEILEKKTILNSLPVFLGLASDYSCNLQCIMCFRRLMENGKQYTTKPLEEKHLINFARETFPTAKYLQLNTVGEPLMAKNFDLELDLAEEYQVKIMLVTNGILINAKQGGIDKLCRNLKSIVFSFDSPIKDNYESIRIGSDFNRVVDNMRLFGEKRKYLDEAPRFIIGMVIMKKNLHDLLPMIKFAKEIGADFLDVSWLYVHSEEMRSESLEESLPKVSSIFEEAINLAFSTGIGLSLPPINLVNPDDALDVKVEKQVEPVNCKQENKICPFLWERTYIDMNADITPCCNPAHPVAGSLTNNPFIEIWNGEIYRKMRDFFFKDSNYEFCKTCANNGYLSKLKNISLLGD